MPETPEEEREETAQDHGHATWAGLFEEIRADEAAKKLEIEQGNQEFKTLLNEKSTTPEAAQQHRLIEAAAGPRSYEETLQEAAARTGGSTGKDRSLER